MQMVEGKQKFDKSKSEQRYQEYLKKTETKNAEKKAAQVETGTLWYDDSSGS
jgi:hypothetical protein